MLLLLPLPLGHGDFGAFALSYCQLLLQLQQLGHLCIDLGLLCLVGLQLPYVVSLGAWWGECDKNLGALRGKTGPAHHYHSPAWPPPLSAAG